MSEAVTMMMQQMAQSMESGASAKTPVTGGEGSDFAKLFDDKLQSGQVEEQVNDMIKDFGLSQQQQVADKVIPGPNLSLDAVQPVSGSQITSTPNKILSFLSEVNRGQLQMDGIIEYATSGQKMSAQTLLGVQVGVYQFAHELELATKVVEQGSNAHKTLWNTNFQG